MAQNSFQFGVEIELLLGSRKKSHPNWKSLARDLSKRLAKAGIPNHVNEGNDKSHENYREWSLTQEITIPSQPAKNLWGIELVSPIYHAAAYWASDLSKIFSVVSSSSSSTYQIIPSPHCSTHVHISGTPVPLSSSELAALAKAVLYYEPALDMLVPSGRRGSTAYWCQSNRVNPALGGTSLVSCLQYLDSIMAASGGGDEEQEEQVKRNVIAAMNLFPANSAYGRAHGKKKDFLRGKVYKWDFTGMLGPNQRGTVEFRQPPGVQGVEDAMAWITLALAFVVGATSPRIGAMGTVGMGMFGGGLNGNGVGGEGEEGATPEELWGLLVAGGEILGWEGLGAVEGLFARRG